MLENLIVGKTPRAPKLVIHGEEKMGKSTFASQAPKPLFIDIEGGLNYIDTTKTQRITESSQVINVISSLIKEKHDFKTLVIDSIDWLEDMCGKEIAEAHGASSIGDSSCKALSYGAGYQMLKDKITRILSGLDKLRDEQNINIIIIAHSVKTTVDDDTMADPYQKHELKLNRRVAEKVKEWADIIAFAKIKRHVVEGKAFDDGRELLANKQSSFSGGGRVTIKDPMPLSWDGFINQYNKEL